MKSFIVAFLIAIFITSSSYLYNDKMDSFSKQMMTLNNEVFKKVISEDSVGAILSLDELSKYLDENKVLLSATGDHQDITKLEIAKSELLEYVKCGQFPDARAKCAELDTLIKHLPSNYKLKAENIL